MQDFRQIERQGWGERAAEYAGVTALSTLQFVPMLLHAARIRPGLRLFDLCCGPGFAGAAAATLGLSVRAEDFAPEMVAEARRRFGSLDGLEIAEGDAERLDHADRSADRVICNFGMMHLAEPERAIAEAFRVLRPGGVYAFTQWDTPERSALQGMVASAVQAHADLGRLPPAPDAFHFSEPANAEAALARAGFEEVRTVRVEAVLPGPRQDFMDYFRRYAVRAPMAVALQEPEVQARIIAEVDAAAQAFAEGDGVMVPNPGYVYSGRRPA